MAIATQEDFMRNELKNAHDKFSEIHGRKLGSEANEQMADLISTLDAHIDRCSWFARGDYGSEFHHLVRHWLEDLPATPKRRDSALQRIASQVFILCACLDYGDINPRKITAELKKEKIDFTALNNKILDEIQEQIDDILNGE